MPDGQSEEPKENRQGEQINNIATKHRGIRSYYKQFKFNIWTEQEPSISYMTSTTEQQRQQQQ